MSKGHIETSELGDMIVKLLIRQISERTFYEKDGAKVARVEYADLNNLLVRTEGHEAFRVSITRVG